MELLGSVVAGRNLTSAQAAYVTLDSDNNRMFAAYSRISQKTRVFPVPAVVYLIYSVVFNVNLRIP